MEGARDADHPEQRRSPHWIWLLDAVQPGGSEVSAAGIKWTDSGLDRKLRDHLLQLSSRQDSPSTQISMSSPPTSPHQTQSRKELEELGSAQRGTTGVLFAYDLHKTICSLVIFK